uniref:Uncharacterized protein n=1 Tax=Panagrolaimus superbus TaxID=310955 RepID=A0A914XT48_9BILA
MTDCKADIVFKDSAGKSVQESVSFMFFDTSRSGYDVEIVRSGDDPSLVTLDLGVEKLWDRIFTLGVFTVLLIGGAIAVIVAMIRANDTPALAVLPQGCDVPVLLDENLDRLDLTADEKQAIHNALAV